VKPLPHFAAKVPQSGQTPTTTASYRRLYVHSSPPNNHEERHSTPARILQGSGVFCANAKRSEAAKARIKANQFGNTAPVILPEPDTGDTRDKVAKEAGNH
jgi:hypothetical protein